MFHMTKMVDGHFQPVILINQNNFDYSHANRPILFPHGILCILTRSVHYMQFSNKYHYAQHIIGILNTQNKAKIKPKRANSNAIFMCLNPRQKVHIKQFHFFGCCYCCCSFLMFIFLSSFVRSLVVVVICCWGCYFNFNSFFLCTRYFSLSIVNLASFPFFLYYHLC